MARIRVITVEPVRVSPAEAVLLVHVELDAPLPGAEVRGKLVGPRCPGVSTVEIAYPLRPLPATSDTALSLRAVVPEPNLWTAATPYRYDGRAEVWAGGARVAAEAFAVELRPRAG
jgi:hypothetical protein